MGPTKAIIKNQALYEAATGKFIKDGFASRHEIEDYVKHHYLALPVIDNAGNAWLLDGNPIYCYRGSQYETVGSIAIEAANTKRWTIDASIWPVARTAEGWGSGATNLPLNPIAFAA